MAVNERVQLDVNDIPFGQLAPSQAARTNFTPGTRSACPLDMNWPKDFRIPTGVRSLDDAPSPCEVERVRVIKLRRNAVCDQTVLESVVENTVVLTVECDCEGTIGTHTLVETETPENLTERERRTGYDWARGA